MELKDIKDLIKVLKDEEIAEIKVRYGKVKLVLTNSDTEEEEVKKVETKTEKVVVTKEVEPKKSEEVIKSKNVGKIKLKNLEKGLPVTEGMILATIDTMGVQNEIKSTVKGILKEILVSDQATVDYAKPLFIIEI